MRWGKGQKCESAAATTRAATGALCAARTPSLLTPSLPPTQTHTQPSLTLNSFQRCSLFAILHPPPPSATFAPPLSASASASIPASRQCCARSCSPCCRASRCASSLRAICWALVASRLRFATARVSASPACACRSRTTTSRLDRGSAARRAGHTSSASWDNASADLGHNTSRAERSRTEGTGKIASNIHSVACFSVSVCAIQRV